MTFCPFCGVRQDIDLRQIHFRDLGTDEALACPSCSTGLSVIEFETDPTLRIERCKACHGMFFNPGDSIKVQILETADTSRAASNPQPRLRNGLGILGAASSTQPTFLLQPWRSSCPASRIDVRPLLLE
ncbi:MAG: zf-TFIIB domain-containing protein [Akkermansiaceae bacterium]